MSVSSSMMSRVVQMRRNCDGGPVHALIGNRRMMAEQCRRRRRPRGGEPAQRHLQIEVVRRVMRRIDEPEKLRSAGAPFGPASASTHDNVDETSRFTE